MVLLLLGGADKLTGFNWTSSRTRGDFSLCRKVLNKKTDCNGFYSIWFELLGVISMVVLSPLIAMLNYCCNVTRNIEIRILNISFLVNIDF